MNHDIDRILERASKRGRNGWMINGSLKNSGAHVSWESGVFFLWCYWALAVAKNDRKWYKMVSVWIHFGYGAGSVGHQ